MAKIVRQGALVTLVIIIGAFSSVALLGSLDTLVNLLLQGPSYFYSWQARRLTYAGNLLSSVTSSVLALTLILSVISLYRGRLWAWYILASWFFLPGAVMLFFKEAQSGEAEGMRLIAIPLFLLLSGIMLLPSICRHCGVSSVSPLRTVSVVGLLFAAFCFVARLPYHSPGVFSRYRTEMLEEELQLAQNNLKKASKAPLKNYLIFAADPAIELGRLDLAQEYINALRKEDETKDPYLAIFIKTLSLRLALKRKDEGSVSDAEKAIRAVIDKRTHFGCKDWYIYADLAEELCLSGRKEQAQEFSDRCLPGSVHGRQPCLSALQPFSLEDLF